MSRYYSYLNSAKQILEEYEGEIPFASYIKKYFSLHKKFGSGDRRQVSHLCYCYFRTGNLLKSHSLEEAIILGLYLCSEASNDMLAVLKPELNESSGKTVQEKLSMLEKSNNYETIFPCVKDFSDEVEKVDFILSHFRQPDIFIRVRPGHEGSVISKLEENEIKFCRLNGNAISILPSSKIENLIDWNREAVIQDLSSQRVGEFFIRKMDESKIGRESLKSVWDACAASGGKAIMVFDLLQKIQLTVTDIRESILNNLRSRFRDAGIVTYNSMMVDLTNEKVRQSGLKGRNFELVIADVPCTGSGTWGRTPEQLKYFECRKVEEYALLQRMILSNVIPFIKENGLLLYITCSVYKKENEEQVKYLQETGLRLLGKELLSGYTERADTMFVALFLKETVGD